MVVQGRAWPTSLGELLGVGIGGFKGEERPACEEGGGQASPPECSHKSGSGVTAGAEGKGQFRSVLSPAENSSSRPPGISSAAILSSFLSSEAKAQEATAPCDGRNITPGQGCVLGAGRLKEKHRVVKE